MLTRSISRQILLAVIIGIFVGLFFGPLANILTPIGSVYTMLLQMAVLPYLCFSLIHGLGSITPETGKKLFKKGWPYLLAIWVLIFLILFILIQLIPNTIPPLFNAQGTSNFETSFTQNFLTYLVPENPFYDMANNIVPAIAIFGLIGGVALMHIEKKEPLIGMLERVNQGIEKILKWLGILSPIAAFSYISIAFGTIYLEDFYKLQIYIFAYVLTSLFVTFWLLPTLLIGLTPLKYKDVFKAFRFVCLLPFVTGLTTAALPFLNNYLKKLSAHHAVHKKFRETSQTVLPIAYSFGNIGNAMILFFIMFLAYYYRQPLTELEQWLLTILTFPLSIGSSTSNMNSILFLIQELGFKQGASEFFLQIKSFTVNFQVLMSIASVLTLLILTLYSYYGLLQIKWKYLVIRLSSAFILFTLLVMAFRAYIPIGDVYKDLYMGLKLLNHQPSNEAHILKRGETGVDRTYPNPLLPETLKKILNTKTLKVGFNPNSIPFCYYNNDKELVGFDIAYAFELADSLNCKIEFVPFDFNALGQDLWDGVFDIGMSSIIMNESRILNMDFTLPYYEDSMALIVPVIQKNNYISLEDVEQRKGLTIGSEGAGIEIAKKHFPKANIVPLKSDIVRFDKGLDAILWSKTTGMIWCLSNPDYICIDYGNQIGKNFFSYPIRQHAMDFSFFLNSWLTLKDQSGFKKEMISYWIDGTPPNTRPPRWSILKNVILSR